MQRAPKKTRNEEELLAFLCECIWTQIRYHNYTSFHVKYVLVCIVHTNLESCFYYMYNVHALWHERWEISTRRIPTQTSAITGRHNAAWNRTSEPYTIILLSHMRPSFFLPVFCFFFWFVLLSISRSYNRRYSLQHFLMHLNAQMWTEYRLHKLFCTLSLFRLTKTT